MVRLLLVIGTLLGFAVLAAPEDKKAKPGKNVVLTGCLDERGEKYVLAEDTELKKITELRGKGFSDDNFARFVGHRVRVHGSPGEAVFHVTRIEDLAAGCSPKDARLKPVFPFSGADYIGAQKSVGDRMREDAVTQTPRPKHPPVV